MCGLAALFTKEPTADVSTIVRRMMEIAKHRGPDGHGLQAGQGDHCTTGSQPASWVLGHRRLAILDLSDAGLQPMSLPDGRLWITYNGEVYNYLELREDLRSVGYQFRTQTDTEVVLAGYRHWGERCVERFRGMFAMVVVDLQKSRVFFARDRLGIKPLYCWSDGQRMAVVSEPKQLTALPQFQATANRQQLVDYLAEGVLGHEPYQSMFAGVVPMPAGHRMTFTLGEIPDVAATSRYWRPERTTQQLGWSEAVESTGEIIKRAVQLRLRSDVPVGTCLSGGIDSSSIVAVASHDFQAKMNTFSICSNDPRINEQPYIDAVNQHCGTSPVKQFLDDEAIDRDLEAFIWQQDEPVFSLSQYAEYSVMRLARDHNVTVLLNGQGGDEALCGYRKYAYFYLRELLRERRPMLAGRHVTATILRGDRQLLQLWQGIRYAPAWLRRRYDPIENLLRDDWRSYRRSAWRSRMANVSSLHHHQWEDLVHWSLPVLLRYQDRNSMAHGVEARVPLVDHEFLEFCLRLPEAYFFRRGMTKRLLVDAMGERLPEALRRRRTKLGFDTPQPRWLRGAIGHRLEAAVRRSQRLAEVVDTAAVGDAFEQYRRGNRRIPHFLLFRFGCAAIWMEAFQVQP